MIAKRMKSRSVRRSALVFGSLAVIVAIGWIMRFYLTDPYLPDGTDAAIDSVLRQDLPELVRGVTGYAESGGPRIWYEVLAGDGTPRGTVLLIRGYTRTALSWGPEFIDPLVAAGYRVVRFDNRDVGMSDWIADWGEETRYTVVDMANDAVRVLDAVGVDRAHVVGISMGGAIAQEMAMRWPARVGALTLIATSTGRDEGELRDTEFSDRVIRIALRYGVFSDIRSQLKLRIAVEEAVRGEGNYMLDLEQVAQTALYEIRRRRGSNPKASEHHLAAVEGSPSRHLRLSNLRVPALVVHGSADCLTTRAQAEALAAAIPDARTLWLQGMGHDVVPPYTDRVVARLIELMSEQEDSTGSGRLQPSADAPNGRGMSLLITPGAIDYSDAAIAKTG